MRAPRYRSCDWSRDHISNNKVCDKIKSEIIKYYQNSEAHILINDLFKTGEFMNDTKLDNFGNSQIANPLYFKDFICEKSNWIKGVVACELDNKYQLGLSRRATIPHSEVVSFVHKYAKHWKTTQSVLERNSVVFLNYAGHWYVLIPYEKNIGL